MLCVCIILLLSLELAGAMTFNDRKKYEAQTRWTTLLVPSAEHEVDQLKTVENSAKAAKDDLHRMKEAMSSNMKNDFSGMKSNFDLITQHQNDMEKELSGMKDYQDEMKNDLNQMKRNMNKFLGGMEKEVNSMKQQSETNFTQTNSLKKDLVQINREVNEMKKDVRTILNILNKKT